MSATPIADHALLSDRHSAAPVTSAGSIDWLCFPRFDSPSVFGAILDDDAGHWSIRPAGGTTTERKYVPGSMALKTTFDTGDGTLELTDAMALGRCSDPHRLGEQAPHAVLRGLHCTRGRVTAEVSFRARPEYGLMVPVLSSEGSAVLVTGGPSRFTLSTPGPLECKDGEARGVFNLSEGERVFFALQREPLGTAQPDAYDQQEIADALASTIAHWREWSQITQIYEGTNQVQRIVMARQLLAGIQSEL